MKTDQKDRASAFWMPFTPIEAAKNPLRVASGQGSWLVLEDGSRLLDGISSWWVNLHGHGKREIAEAIYHQALTLEQVIPAGLTHGPAEALAQGVLSHLPEYLCQMFYSDDGSTAVEVALKMAVQYWWNQGETGRTRFLAFEGAYHGDTLGAMSVGDRSSGFSDPFRPLMFDVTYLPWPSTWDDDEDVEFKEATALKALDEALENHGDTFAGLIMEPLIQGAGGMRFCRPEFLQGVQNRMKAAGLLVIYDEVMTGFGRTGEWFACVKAKTFPDIVCLSKGITGGFLPLGATVTTQKVQDAFLGDDPSRTFWHGHSYTANPLACAAGLASLKLMEEEPFRKFENWHRELGEAVKNHPRISRFRVMGTIAAMELISDGSGGYFDASGPLLRKAFLDAGVLLRPLGNVIYILPPYCTTREELALIYETIAAVVDGL
ncbi:adenosylmethionine--8-amino-7-oxononanoate transaminase [Desulfobotulus mexicanus]|uniref:Adenosylmethionine-8-amino-7-oxononanoate aminotransferase n=1 Tax=Desulfobotulus mexicanus TaxID=2586642 RepID=A0A5Q4VAT0_9BACT|nr:adenosylmethionine--8-amino-7-oxononanoate transaminase [Desulfobotulus mexicanus]TYT74655.1 adenosylmethionine--8-amino-7-oxononanoate transaminase [Desulfobotulus mexicanus]